MATLLDEEGKQHVKAAEEGKNKEDEEEEDELDDDLLMSEQFVHEQNERDKDKEKMALRKSRETNVSQYLFDIVSGRCQSVARAFFEWIDEAVWQALEEDVFKDIEQEKIRASVQPILDMKQL